MATLIVLTSPCRGARLILNKSRQVVVGRDPTCDLVLNKRSISRFHAQLSISKGAHFLEDMKSTNGTFINGNKIHNRVGLKDGDRIVIHDIPIAFFESDAVTAEEENRACESISVVPGSAPLIDAEKEVVPVGGSGVVRGRLKILLEMTRELGSLLEIKEILPRILDLLFRMFPSACIGEIYLLSPDRHLTPVAMKHGREADSTDLTGKPFNLDLVTQVFESGQGTVRTCEANDKEMAIDGFFQSVLCAPLLGAKSEPFGVILLETNDTSYVFGQDDLELLTAVAVVAGQAIGYSQSHEIVVQHEHTIRQMETARQIQLGMLPRKRPEVAGYRFGHHYAAAEKVGGDYFFYEMLRDGRVILGIADASGKGLSAAMNIARFAGEVRLRIATSPTLKFALASLNQFVMEGADECMFITACLCVLDPQLHQVALANAGHPPPLIKRKATNRVDELQGPRRNFPLGVDAVFDAHPYVVNLEPGDQLLLFTDGVTESMNSEFRLFGTERLMQTVSQSEGNVDRVVEDIVNSVGNFHEWKPPSDDMTIVAFERFESET